MLFTILGIISLSVVAILFIFMGIFCWWGANMMGGSLDNGEKVFSIVLIAIGVGFFWYICSHLTIQLSL